jgi:hypothetical protein
MVWVSLDSASLNFSNRRMRTRLSGGVAGEERKLSPYADCSYLLWVKPLSTGS